MNSPNQLSALLCLLCGFSRRTINSIGCQQIDLIPNQLHVSLLNTIKIRLITQLNGQIFNQNKQKNSQRFKGPKAKMLTNSIDIFDFRAALAFYSSEWMWGGLSTMLQLTPSIDLKQF